MMIVKDGRRFEIHRDLIDVTSLHRPDINWLFIDPAGHEHRWHFKTPDEWIIAYTYEPQQSYGVPSVEKVVDSPGYSDDYTYIPEVFHHECRICRAHVHPGYIADDYKQFITGLIHYTVDGESVSEDEFIRQAEAAGLPVENLKRKKG